MAPIASADHPLRGRNCTKLNREITQCAARIPRAPPAEANSGNVHAEKCSLNTTPFTTSDYSHALSRVSRAAPPTREEPTRDSSPSMKTR